LGITNVDVKMKKEENEIKEEIKKKDRTEGKNK
jgi:hypothetical protein